jgi:ParB-like chromosome segregation protein Spo0J
MTDTARTWPTSTVLTVVETGDANTWAEEIAFLWRNDTARMIELLRGVLANGIRQPISIALTDDGGWRMWDGHHRVAIAVALQLPAIPIRIHRE